MLIQESITVELEWEEGGGESMVRTMWSLKSEEVPYSGHLSPIRRRILFQLLIVSYSAREMKLLSTEMIGAMAKLRRRTKLRFREQKISNGKE